jgi:hypothetical protein
VAWHVDFAGGRLVSDDRHTGGREPVEEEGREVVRVAR